MVHIAKEEVQDQDAASEVTPSQDLSLSRAHFPLSLLGPPTMNFITRIEFKLSPHPFFSSPGKALKASVSYQVRSKKSGCKLAMESLSALSHLAPRSRSS